jgi:hypothetical protein
MPFSVSFCQQKTVRKKSTNLSTTSCFSDMNHEDGGGQPLDLGENFGGDLDKALEKEINAPAHKTQPRLTRSVGQPLKSKSIF